MILNVIIKFVGFGELVGQKKKERQFLSLLQLNNYKITKLKNIIIIHFNELISVFSNCVFSLTP